MTLYGINSPAAFPDVPDVNDYTARVRRELMVHFALAIATRATPPNRNRRLAKEIMAEAEDLADACMETLNFSPD